MYVKSSAAWQISLQRIELRTMSMRLRLGWFGVHVGSSRGGKAAKSNSVGSPGEGKGVGTRITSSPSVVSQPDCTNVVGAVHATSSVNAPSEAAVGASTTR